MKKFNKFGFASAIVLAGAMGFAACSSDDEEFVELNPTFDGNSVKTQFAISLTKKVNKGGRMTADQVQANDGEFQGMTNIRLFHFKQNITSNSSNVGMTVLGDIDGFDYQNSTMNLNAKTYNNLDIQTGVSHFLFYGQTANADIKGNQYTEVDYADALESVTETTFTPVSIVSKTADQLSGASDMVRKWNNIYNAFDEVASLPIAIASYKQVVYNMVNGGPASSNAMKDLVQDIYFAINTEYLSMEEGATKEATGDLMDKLLEYADLKVDATTSTTLAWNSTDPNFPMNNNIPEGSVALQITNDVISINTNYEDYMSTNVVDFVYPASLFYYAKSAAKVNNAPYFSADGFNASDKNWTDIVGDFGVGAISATTRSVILENQVQYGVARLETTVKFVNESSIPSSDVNNPVNITDKTFPVTGVLVGGQKQVGWDFTPTTPDDQYVIWDGTMTKTMSAGKNSATGINHTLVYETASEAVVNIAIELENNSGADFKGVNGCVVPAGAKFYLVASLNPKATTGVTQPNGETLDQVFKQDYVTLANLTITSLAKAYNVIPNLEQSKLEFGMSVKLHWETGLKFDVNVQ